MLPFTTFYVRNNDTRLINNDTANLRGMERTILFNRKTKAVHCNGVITWCLTKILPSLMFFIIFL